MICKRTILSLVALVTAIVLTAHKVGANTCGPPRRVSVPRACGQVLDTNGRPIPNLEVGLLSVTGESVAVTTSDANGRFSFSGAKAGSYDLYSKSGTWDEMRWPIKFSRAEGNKCGRPLYMILSPKTGWGCMSWVTKKKPDLKLASDH